MTLRRRSRVLSALAAFATLGGGSRRVAALQALTQDVVGIARVLGDDEVRLTTSARACADAVHARVAGAAFALLSTAVFEQSEAGDNVCDRCVLMQTSTWTETLHIGGACLTCRGEDIRLTPTVFARAVVVRDVGDEDSELSVRWRFAPCREQSRRLANDSNSRLTPAAVTNTSALPQTSAPAPVATPASSSTPNSPMMSVTPPPISSPDPRPSPAVAPAPPIRLSPRTKVKALTVAATALSVRARPSAVESPAPRINDAADTSTLDKSVQLSAVSAVHGADSDSTQLATTPGAVAQRQDALLSVEDEETYAPLTSESPADSVSKRHGNADRTDSSPRSDALRTRENLSQNPFFLVSAVALAVVGVVGAVVTRRAKMQQQRRHANQQAAWRMFSQRVRTASVQSHSIGTPSPGGVGDAYAVSSTTRHAATVDASSRSPAVCASTRAAVTAPDALIGATL